MQVLVKIFPLWIVTQGESSELLVLDQNDVARPKLISHKIPVWIQLYFYYISNLDADISLTCPPSTSPALSGSSADPICPAGWLGRAGTSLEWGSVQCFITSQTPFTKKYLLKFSVANVVISLKSGLFGNSRCLSGAGRARLQCWVSLKELDCFDFPLSI